jgi:hypothetical protein
MQPLSEFLHVMQTVLNADHFCGEVLSSPVIRHRPAVRRGQGGGQGGRLGGALGGTLVHNQPRLDTCEGLDPVSSGDGLRKIQPKGDPPACARARVLSCSLHNAF